MKVLIIHPYTFSQYKGGVERYIENLKKGLLGKVEISQINDYYFRFFGEPLPKIEIFRIIKSKRPDILHLHGPRPFATILGIWAKILKIKTLLTYHAHLNPKNYLKKIIAGFDRVILKYFFDLLIVTSENYKNKVKKFFPEEGIKVVPLLIEEDFFRYPKTKEECRKELLIGKEKTVLFVGKLDKHHYYKGADILIEAAKFLPKEIRIILIGGGDKKEEYEKKALNLKVSDRVEFKGEVGQEELMKHYKSADIFVLPSISDSEGFGFVLLEAMAMGLPVITTEVVGSAEIIKKNKAGLIIIPNNPQVLAQAIQQLLKDDIFYQILKENSKKLAEEFRIEKNINKFLEIYKCLKNQ